MEVPNKDSPRNPRLSPTPREDTGITEESSFTSLHPVQELEPMSPRMRTPSPKRKYGESSYSCDDSDMPPSSKKGKLETETKEAVLVPDSQVTGTSKDQSLEEPLKACAVTSSGTQTEDNQASSSSSADHPVNIVRSLSEDSEASAETTESMEYPEELPMDLPIAVADPLTASSSEESQSSTDLLESAEYDPGDNPGNCEE